jgi:hypothetical protein
LVNFSNVIATVDFSRCLETGPLNLHACNIRRSVHVSGKKRAAERSEPGGLFPGGVSHTVSLTNTPVSGDQLQPLLAIPDIVVNLDSNAVNIGRYYEDFVYKNRRV